MITSIHVMTVTTASLIRMPQTAADAAKRSPGAASVITGSSPTASLTVVARCPASSSRSSARSSAATVAARFRPPSCSSTTWPDAAPSTMARSIASGSGVSQSRASFVASTVR